LVRGVLRRHGYRVLDARTPAEAIGISAQHETPIDLLLTDVVMPQMSGRKLADVLTPQRPHMRVLYVSGYTDDTIIHHGVLDAGIAFLQKPLTPATLLRKVREVLDGPQD
ncbi:MAG TPA: response regulator, partial [Polyangiales bacterium]|nr:response regulator [Polyangiales bacterium]